MGETTFDPPALMLHTFALMESCELVVIDLAEKGVGVGIEAGYACACSQQVIAIAPAGLDISTTLQGIASTVCSYADYSVLTTFFPPAIVSGIVKSKHESGQNAHKLLQKGINDEKHPDDNPAVVRILVE